MKAIWGQKKVCKTSNCRKLFIFASLFMYWTCYSFVKKRKESKEQHSSVNFSIISLIIWTSTWVICSDAQISRTEEAPSQNHKLKHENPKPDRIRSLILDVWGACASWSQHSKPNEQQTTFHRLKDPKLTVNFTLPALISLKWRTMAKLKRRKIN